MNSVFERCGFCQQEDNQNLFRFCTCNFFYHEECILKFKTFGNSKCRICNTLYSKGDPWKNPNSLLKKKRRKKKNKKKGHFFKSTGEGFTIEECIFDEEEVEENKVLNSKSKVESEEPKENKFKPEEPKPILSAMVEMIVGK